MRITTLIRPFALSIFCSLVATALAPAAQAYSNQELINSMNMLDGQIEKLEKLSPRSCPAEFSSYAGLEKIKISIFYGYANFDEYTIDQALAAGLGKVLQLECPRNVEACDFKVVGRAFNLLQLAKKIRGREVLVSIHATSVTDSDEDNSNFGKAQWQQYYQSRAVWQDFHREVQQSDVVFYSGHSRHGAGLGFNISSLGSDAFNYVFKFPFTNTLEALRRRPSRLKLLGLFGCSTDEYYRPRIEEANPRVSLIVSKDEISNLEGEQSLIGALNSVLMEKCEPDFKKSLFSVDEKGPRHMEYIRRR